MSNNTACSELAEQSYLYLYPLPIKTLHCLATCARCNLVAEQVVQLIVVDWVSR